ncbi:MAG: efflux RND transporter permease subunit, partial [Nitrospinota bacterium]|nr:efflux RND transporter permease subunit [Nitrospinota bacterium]
IEEEMAELDGLDELISISHEGISEILLKFQTDTDMSRALSDVRGAMDNVADLSDDAKPPLIQEVKYA